MGKRHRRKFTDELEAETVAWIRASGRTVGSEPNTMKQPGPDSSSGRLLLCILSAAFVLEASFFVAYGRFFVEPL